MEETYTRSSMDNKGKHEDNENARDGNGEDKAEI